MILSQGCIQQCSLRITNESLTPQSLEGTCRTGEQQYRSSLLLERSAGGRNVAASADGGRISDCCEDLKP